VAFAELTLLALVWPHHTTKSSFCNIRIVFWVRRQAATNMSLSCALHACMTADQEAVLPSLPEYRKVHENAVAVSIISEND
jgi:hypothetical protein